MLKNPRDFKGTHTMQTKKPSYQLHKFNTIVFQQDFAYFLKLDNIKLTCKNKHESYQENFRQYKSKRILCQKLTETLSR